MTRLLRRRPAAALALAGLAAGSAALTVTAAAPANSVPVDSCPEAFPTADLVPGQLVDGLTTSQGTVPDEFTGEVLGVLDDGIAPGLDMILVRLSNTEIDRVGGIWQGMSGSPVFALDGRLIGAVSYGLAVGPSTVAGVTPAADMQALLDLGTGLNRTPATRSAAKKVTLPTDVRRELVADGALSRVEAEGGLSPLPVPFAVSGFASNARLNKAAKRLDLPAGVRLYRAGKAPVTPVAAALPVDVDIVPGGNLAASLAYGDFSAVGVGTVTTVCDQDLVGFGHPMQFSGATTMTLHGANALYVQEDPTVAPFKVANPTGPVGIIDQDRLAGIKGTVGDAPETTSITSLVSLVGGSSRTGETFVSVPDFLPDATALANLVNQDRVLDRYGKGSALTRFTIEGTVLGEPFTLARTNRYASRYDISFGSIFELADAVYTLQQNEFAAVDIDSVSSTTTLDDEWRAYRMGRIERLGADGVWRGVKQGSVLRTNYRQAIRLRVTLRSFRDELPRKLIEVRIPMPAEAFPGSGGELVVSGGGGWSEPDIDPEASGVDNVQALVDWIARAPRNDQLVGELFLENGSDAQPAPVRRLVGDVVRGNRYFRVRVN